MATIDFAPEVAGDFERILDHLVRHHADEGEARIEDIIDALEVLRHSPLIGRPVDQRLRELVMGRGRRGYVALYAFDAVNDVVRVLRVWHQREDR
ncbi:MAG: type II toxin-antitoxin system RelE/ParE family toxin [Myxococcaceae bacterium]|nr:type II toxin-antitoxin system RelE/ParE family toxin [Myxococcaceae bacterium]